MGRKRSYQLAGKACFRHHQERGIEDAWYRVSAWSKRQGLSLGQGQVDGDGKSNEINAGLWMLILGLDYEGL